MRTGWKKFRRLPTQWRLEFLEGLIPSQPSESSFRQGSSSLLWSRAWAISCSYTSTIPITSCSLWKQSKIKLRCSMIKGSFWNRKRRNSRRRSTWLTTQRLMLLARRRKTGRRRNKSCLCWSGNLSTQALLRLGPRRKRSKMIRRGNLSSYRKRKFKSSF